MLTLTCEDVDALRAHPDESGLWFHDDEPKDPDETPLEIEIPIVVTDDDGETDSAEPVEVPDDVFDREALTLLQHDAVEYLLRIYSTAEVSGRSVWIPRTRTGPMPVSTDRGIVLLHTEPTVFRAGCWVDLGHDTLTGG